MFELICFTADKSGDVAWREECLTRYDGFVALAGHVEGSGITALAIHEMIYGCSDCVELPDGREIYFGLNA